MAESMPNTHAYIYNIVIHTGTNAMHHMIHNFSKNI
ncbi:hypothetical protein EG68_07921 [Paragonimus skrjabini miyazakii]|uniref:Uncharacterized protein n=1 Tax=Paragonimus skrjabini miyazakii TaxID=59628 RepID=A0A8S9YUU7_9TREM|nr:hypothetical protein EG68_07921 [Paragonimus skrjabini miyazakii]